MIRNAIEEITSVEKSKDKINLIYHTTPWRGLNVLISVFKKLDMKDVELHVKKVLLSTSKTNRNIK